MSGLLLVVTTSLRLKMPFNCHSFLHCRQMSGRVIWTGTSSLDIQLQLKQGGTTAMRALFTFVARQALGGGSQAINPVVPKTEEDKELFNERQKVADARKAARN